MNFRKYNSIENSYQSSFIEKIIQNGFENETYVVQEKVHGANLSFRFYYNYCGMINFEQKDESRRFV